MRCSIGRNSPIEGMNPKGQSESDPHSAEADSTGDSDRNTSLHHRTARRKVFFLIDSLNVGGTESQAVELATRLSAEHYAERYEVTLGCLRARGPLLEKVVRSILSPFASFIRREAWIPGGASIKCFDWRDFCATSDS